MRLEKVLISQEPPRGIGGKGPDPYSYGNVGEGPFLLFPHKSKSQIFKEERILR